MRLKPSQKLLFARNKNVYKIILIHDVGTMWAQMFILSFKNSVLYVISECFDSELDFHFVLFPHFCADAHSSIINSVSKVFKIKKVSKVHVCILSFFFKVGE